MTNHIKQLCESFIKATQNRNEPKYEGISAFEWPKMIYDEIVNLKATDFEPLQRYNFVILRQKFRKLSTMPGFSHDKLPEFQRIAQSLLTVLDHFSFSGAETMPREFHFISDMELKNIIQRDYRELHCFLMPDGAWKSSVVMAGSILESILYDVLSSPAYIHNAMNSSKAPKKRNGNVIDISTGNWKLISLIEVATDIGVLPAQRAASIDQVLRDYRNFVHPKKEIKSEHPCTEAEAYMSKGCLDGVCNHLDTLIS